MNYNGLIHIDEASDFAIDGLVKSVLSKIRELGFEKLVGVARLHKHFELNDKEAVVLRGTIINEKVGYLAKVETLTDQMPFIFRYLPSEGRWVPSEYCVLEYGTVPL